MLYLIDFLVGVLFGALSLYGVLWFLAMKKVKKFQEEIKRQFPYEIRLASGEWTVSKNTSQLH